MTTGQSRVIKPVEALDSKHRISKSETVTDEHQVWLRFKEGDETAFIWIYEEYFDKLFNFAKQFDVTNDLVKDQIQELFIYIRKNRERLADVRSIKFYLYKSLRRRMMSKMKKRFTVVSLFSKNQDKVFELQVAESAEQNLIEQGIQSQVASNLSKSLNKLTPRQREAVMHFFYEGYTYKEVAELMELKHVKYARKLIYRALESLRQDLPDIKAIF